MTKKSAFFLRVQVKTFSWNISATALQNKFQQALHSQRCRQTKRRDFVTRTAATQASVTTYKKLETCSGTLKLVSKLVHPVSVWRSVTRPSKTTLRGVVLYWFYHQCNGCYRCRNRQRFYFTWYLPHNRSSRKFHETDHITRCNATPAETFFAAPLHVSFT